MDNLSSSEQKFTLTLHFKKQLMPKVYEYQHLVIKELTNILNLLTKA